MSQTSQQFSHLTFTFSALSEGSRVDAPSRCLSDCSLMFRLLKSLPACVKAQ